MRNPLNFPTPELLAGNPDDIHIAFQMVYDRYGKPLAKFLNPPCLCIPVPLDVYNFLPYPVSKHGPYKVKADNELHCIFYVENPR